MKPPDKLVKQGGRVRGPLTVILRKTGLKFKKEIGLKISKKWSNRKKWCTSYAYKVTHPRFLGLIGYKATHAKSRRKRVRGTLIRALENPSNCVAL